MAKPAKKKQRSIFYVVKKVSNTNEPSFTDFKPSLKNVRFEESQKGQQSRTRLYFRNKYSSWTCKEFDIVMLWVPDCLDFDIEGLM